MSGRNEPLWARLVDAGLVEGSAPETKLDSPWYVKVLLAFSGWLAALFLLGFIGMAMEFVFDDSASAGIVGGVMIGAAFAVLRLRKNEFLEHLALAVSLAGQALIVFAILEVSDGIQSQTWFLLALLEGTLAIVMPNFVHRVFSSFVAAAAVCLLLISYGWLNLIGGAILLPAAWCWFNEFRHPRLMERMRALGYGLVLALILQKATAFFGYGLLGWYVGMPPEPQIGARVGELLIGAVMLYVVWSLLQRYGVRLSERVSIAALAGTLLLCAVSMKVQGLSTGMVVILLGFAGSNRVLQGLGIVSLLYFISNYYYLLETTLLAKSLNLLAVGLVLVLLRWLMSLVLPAGREVVHV